MPEPLLPPALNADQLEYRETVLNAGLFDPEWYTTTYLQSGGDTDPLDHYVRSGAATGYSPGPAFDCSYYSSRHLDVTETGADPLAHYARHGRAEGRATATVEFVDRYRLIAASGFFNWSWFSTRYLGGPDPGFDALEHFLQTGANTLHHPSPLFDSEFYATVHTEIKERHLHPLAHYVQFGMAEGRIIRPVGVAAS